MNMALGIIFMWLGAALVSLAVHGFRFDTPLGIWKQLIDMMRGEHT